MESPIFPLWLYFCFWRLIAVYTVHPEVISAVVFDQRSRDKSHQSDGQELSQCPP